MNEPLTPKQAEYIAAMIEAMALGHWRRGISGNLALENWQRLGQVLRESHGLMAVGDLSVERAAEMAQTAITDDDFERTMRHFK